jgi:hypothetical protein
MPRKTDPFGSKWLTLPELPPSARAERYERLARIERRIRRREREGAYRPHNPTKLVA